MGFFLHKFAITKLLCTFDAISKLLASKLTKIANFPYFFSEKTPILGVGDVSEKIKKKISDFMKS